MRRRHARTTPPEHYNWFHLDCPTPAPHQPHPRISAAPTTANDAEQHKPRHHDDRSPPPTRRRNPLHPPNQKRTMMTGNGGNGRPPEVKTDRRGSGRPDTRRGGLVAARRGSLHTRSPRRAEQRDVDDEATAAQLPLSQVAHRRHPPPAPKSSSRPDRSNARTRKGTIETTQRLEQDLLHSSTPVFQIQLM